MGYVSVPTRYTLAEADRIAASIVECLEPYCQRVCVAGSIRRRAETIGDVALVVIAAGRQQVVGLFEDLALTPSVPPVDCLDEALSSLLEHGQVQKRRDQKGRTFWGSSDKRILWRYGAASTDWIGLDVFGATDPTWGVKLALRTGPWQFAKRLVTYAGGGRDGVLPGQLEYKDGGLWRFDRGARRSFVPTPDEATFFRELGLPYLPPEYRFPSSFQTTRRGSGG